MVLRLILVSIVAGLGATPPAETEVVGWSNTVQAWLDARLTEWSARLSIAEAAPAPAAPADLSVASADDEFLVLFGDEPALPAPAPARKPETEIAADPSLITLDDLTALFGDEPAAILPPPIEDAAAANRIFEALVEAMVADFTKEDAVAVAPEVETPAPASSITGQAEVDALEQAFLEAEAECEFAQAFATPIVAAPAVTALPAGEADDDEIGDDFDFVVVAGSTHPVEPVDSPAVAVAEASPVCHPASSEPLLDAVRLTREAAYAWMNLLQTPTIAILPE